MTVDATVKDKCVLFDMFRLLVLKHGPCNNLLENHWETLVNTSVIKDINKIDYKNTEAKIAQAYHMTALKFLINIFNSEYGR